MGLPPRCHPMTLSHELTSLQSQSSAFKSDSFHPDVKTFEGIEYSRFLLKFANRDGSKRGSLVNPRHFIFIQNGSAMDTGSSYVELCSRSGSAVQAVRSSQVNASVELRMLGRAERQERQPIGFGLQLFRNEEHADPGDSPARHQVAPVARPQGLHREARRGERCLTSVG